jgi:hypothetical protein
MQPFPRLSLENFDVWSINMEALFVRKGLGSALSDKEVQADIDQKAKAELLLMVEDCFKFTIHSLSTTKAGPGSTDEGKPQYIL